METVADENPLRSATSRIVTAESERTRAPSDERLRDFIFDGVLGAGLESPDCMDTLYFVLLLADTTGR